MLRAHKQLRYMKMRRQRQGEDQQHLILIHHALQRSFPMPAFSYLYELMAMQPFEI
jgi:hypothetical protein